MVQAFLWSFLTSFNRYERGGLNNLMKSLYWLVKFIIIETLWSSPKMQINLKQHKSLTGFVFKNLSSHVRESKTVLDFGFQVMDSAFQVLDSSCQWNFDSGFQSLVWFRIYLAIFRIPKPRIPDSTNKNFPYSEIRFRGLERVVGLSFQDLEGVLGLSFQDLEGVLGLSFRASEGVLGLSFRDSEGVLSLSFEDLEGILGLSFRASEGVLGLSFWDLEGVLGLSFWDLEGLLGLRA